MPADTLATILIPDVVTIDFAAAVHFPNGRRLEDDVIDAALSLVLNRGNVLGGGPALPDGVGANDVAFGTTFPFLAEPHMPAPVVGETGPQGPQGAQGSAGSRGAAGAQGSAGGTGSAGPSGAAGPQGVAGPTGDAGPAGADGSNGAAGAAGQQGPQGSTGDAGDDAVNGLAIAALVLGALALVAAGLAAWRRMAS